MEQNPRHSPHRHRDLNVFRPEWFSAEPQCSTADGLIISLVAQSYLLTQKQCGRVHMVPVTRVLCLFSRHSRMLPGPNWGSIFQIQDKNPALGTLSPQIDDHASKLGDG